MAKNILKMPGEKAHVELYNLWRKGYRHPANGYYVFRYVDGRRHNMLADYKEDGPGARAFARDWNRQHRLERLRARRR